MNRWVATAGNEIEADIIVGRFYGHSDSGRALDRIVDAYAAV